MEIISKEIKLNICVLLQILFKEELKKTSLDNLISILNSNKFDFYAYKDHREFIYIAIEKRNSIFNEIECKVYGEHGIIIFDSIYQSLITSTYKNSYSKIYTDNHNDFFRIYNLLINLTIVDLINLLEADSNTINNYLNWN